MDRFENGLIRIAGVAQDEEGSDQQACSMCGEHGLAGFTRRDFFVHKLEDFGVA